MSTEELMSYAEARGHKVIYLNLQATQAITMNDGGSFIALSNKLMGVEEKEVAAHELGHCEYGGTYNRCSPYEISSRAERRAEKWAYYRLVPPGEIRAAFGEGIIEFWELAERFDVSCRFMGEALAYYRSVGVL